ncbi:hypothetical protein H310_08314 [Aphanomyces invadans]|uniref:Uncharacterized protein n=1 Tax=Aphanomyces invadans TaxID=157072 RepID=A0A024TXT8_9STRA|nr:hypothetical protein H310_08314 [Aphanomyces invadans]ETV98809.1 hypothetical protein H310_08314 [Aphanomyces invadans]|eukprot:XP_008872237.1 hypothetical protein H310_08314 [Aphanomyces invadans]
MTQSPLRHLEFTEFTDVRFGSQAGPFDVTMATVRGNMPLQLWLRCANTDAKWECTVQDTAVAATGIVFVWDNSSVIHALAAALKCSRREPLPTVEKVGELDLEWNGSNEPAIVLTIDRGSALESTYTFRFVRSAVAPIAVLQATVDKLERENHVLHRALASPTSPISVVVTSKAKVPRDTFLTWTVSGWLDPSQFALTTLMDAVMMVHPGKYCISVRGQFDHRHGHNAIVLFLNGVAVMASPGNKAVDTVDIAHVVDVPANACVQVLHRGGSDLNAGATLALYWLAASERCA